MSNTWKDSRDLKSSNMDRARAKAERKSVKQQRKLERTQQANANDADFSVMDTFYDSWAD